MRVDSWVLSRVGSRPPHNDVISAVCGRWCLNTSALWLDGNRCGYRYFFLGGLCYGEDGGQTCCARGSLSGKCSGLCFVVG